MGGEKLTLSNLVDRFRGCDNCSADSPSVSYVPDFSSTKAMVNLRHHKYRLTVHEQGDIIIYYYY